MNPDAIQRVREGMRRSGAALAECFRQVFDLVRPGAAIIDIDRAFEERIRARGALPAFKGYGGGGGHKPYPAATCISVEEQVVHGIPSSRKLVAGQIVSIDAGLELGGWFADMACTLPVGQIDDLRMRLMTVTRQALYLGIDKARAKGVLINISSAVQDHVEKHDFSVVRDLVGHGIGRRLHEPPQVPNYRASGARFDLKEGLTLAIEPMVAAGTWRVKFLGDGWTVTTADGSPSAHFEHTILIGENGPEIMTLLSDGSDPWSLAACFKG